MAAILTAKVSAQFLMADHDRITFGGEVGDVVFVSSPRPSTPEWGSHAGMVMVDVRFEGDKHVSTFWTYPDTKWELAD